MAKLGMVRDTFVLVGNAMINKDTTKYVKTETLGKGGWMRKTINLGVKVSSSNKIYVNQEAGFWSDEIVEKTKNDTGFGANKKPNKKENWIYNGEMKDGVWVADNIPFANRFDEDMVNKVPYFKKIRVSLEQDTMGVNDAEGNIKSVPKVDENGNPIYIKKEFLFVGDAIDYIKAHLKHDQRIYVYGHADIHQYLSDKDNQVKTIINRRIDEIRIAKDDEENQANGTTTFYFEKSGFDKSDFKNTRKYSIQGYRTYQNDDKAVVPVPINYIIDCSSANIDWEHEDVKAQVDYLVDIFESAKRDRVYLTQWRYLIFEGNEEVELTEKDLSKDLKQRVKLGFITVEDAIKQQMRGHAVGDKIKEVKLTMPIGENNMVETDYATDDLIPPVFENKAEKVKATIKEEQNEKKEEAKTDITKKFDSMFAG